MPSKNMIKKGKRRQTVKHDYRVHRDAVRDGEAARKSAEESGLPQPVAEQVDEAGETAELKLPEAEIPVLEDLEAEDGVRSFVADVAAKGKRLDAYLAKALPDVSRGRVQMLIENGQVRVEGKPAKASLKLEGGEHLEVEGEPQLAPLRAEPEDIPLKVVYEDGDLAAIDKAADMSVHAGAGGAEHNRGTLVNALLFHFQKELSGEGGALRPGIVHRLDKDTSGLILVAKNDVTHRRLAEMFQSRSLRKVYVALVHGSMAKDEGTVDLPIGRDPVRRTRMTTRRSVESGARPAISHWRVLERLGNREVPGPYGAFTLVEVHIETGRTHQIRVHLASLGHAVVGDVLYGALGKLRRTDDPAGDAPERTLDRNFLHAAELELPHPRTGKPLQLKAPLPPELESFLGKVRPVTAEATPKGQRPARVARIKAK